MSNGPSNAPALSRKTLTGIRGWLAYMAVCLSLSSFRFVLKIPSILNLLHQLGEVSGPLVLLIGYLLAYTAHGLLLMVSTILLFAKNKLTLKFFFLSAACNLASVVFLVLLHTAQAITISLAELLASYAMLAVYVMYFLKSERVRNTLVN